jgi:opacity protein-like surface antigen|tara:strand:- start:94 stop:525 length:432 start_codon:yes stop_codon:yes gene_type:complete
MKKLILTLAVAFTTLMASAQFTVVTTYNTAAEGEDWKMSSLIDNMGIGYSLNDTWTVGLLAAGEDSLGDASYDLWGRYNMDGNMYLSVQAPTEDMMDNLTVGVGYSLSVWKGLNIEPNYSMGLKEDDNGERDGSFNLGLSYKF